MKAIVVFEKKPRLRHIGHLDLMRAMQRALRRSELPVKYSNGFNPHMLLSFASPLPVGMAGEREVMEFPLAEDLSADAVRTALSAALPPDLPCVQVRLCEDQRPSSMSLLLAADWRIRVSEQFPALAQSCAQLMAQKQYTLLKRTKNGDKETDIRPLIFRLEADSEAHSLRALLSLSESSTLRPDLLLTALQNLAGLEAKPFCMVTRTQLYGPRFVPLEEM